MDKNTFFERLACQYPGHTAKEIEFLWKHCVGQACWEYDPWDPDSSADWDWIYDMLDKEIKFLEKEQSL